MDNESGAGLRTFAAIELTAGSADMKIAQTDGARYRVLERLRKRPPEALLDPPGLNAGAALAGVRSLLMGFERAARDYGTTPSALLINGLDDWAAEISRAALELNIPVYMPDAQQCADMAAAAARARIGEASTNLALILPSCNKTRFVTGDGAIAQLLPLGLDRGRFDYILRAGEAERLRRKNGADACALLRDCARACARNLPQLAPDAYGGLVICVDLEAPDLKEGEYSAKQLRRLADDLARELRRYGAEPGYVRDASESYRATCARRALNALLIADEIRARSGFAGTAIVKALALDEALRALARGEQLARAGADVELARRGAERYALARGMNAAQIERVRVVSGMLLKALARAFTDEARECASELMEVAPALLECFGSDGVLRRADVESLPGLDAAQRRQLIAICEACLRRNNADICSQLLPDMSVDAASDEEALFSADMAEADEFSAPDEDEDDAELEGAAKDEGEQPAAGALEEPDGEAETVGDGALDEAPGESAADEDEGAGQSGDLGETDAGDAAGGDGRAAPAQMYYALRLRGLASAGMREYAEMFGGDERADEAAAREPERSEPAHAERDIVGPQLKRARELPLNARVAAILMLAGALHASGANRLSQISVKLGDRGLVVHATAREGATLETTEFKYRAGLIKRIFGIKARLKLVKRGKPTKQRRQSAARHNAEHRISKGSN